MAWILLLPGECRFCFCPADTVLVAGPFAMRSGTSKLLYLFEDFALDCDRRELRRRNELLSVEPQVFDLLQYLICNRDRVVSKDDLLAAVWHGRIVSEATLGSRINAARSAVGDSGD